MVQLADMLGERGVGALMALVAGLTAAGLGGALRGASRARVGLLLGAAAGILLAQRAFGEARMRAVDQGRAQAARSRVALLQPAIDASMRWEDDRAPLLLDRLTNLTRDAEARGADLVVWPEGAYPYRLVHGTRRAPVGESGIVPPGGRAPVLTGLLLNRSDGAAYNSAILATPDGALSEPYDKRHLLWFGETVPLADRAPWLRRVFARGMGLVAGERSVVLRGDAMRAAVLICYEDTLPEAGREAMAPGPNLLVNLTNDAWFSGSSESELHLRIAALRAVELRRDLVRAVNFGPASWIDAAGRVCARAPGDRAGVVMTEPALLESPPTLYARFGDAPWALAALVFANAAVWRTVRRRSLPS
jgi:apolipoprotein N-acyltransferase